jgi:hypothetical protein
VKRYEIEGRRGALGDLGVALHHPRVTYTVEAETADSKALRDTMRKRIGPSRGRKRSVKSCIGQNNGWSVRNPDLYCTDHGDCGRVVKRGEDRGVFQDGRYASIHNPGFSYLLASMDDTVRRYVQRLVEVNADRIEP